MAEKLRGIEADFATWRPVQGRKVLQLIFEVPIEQTQNVLDMLGIPQPGGSKWCAIALLKAKTVEAEGQAPEGGGSPKPFSTLPLSQQAAIRCGDPDFQRFATMQFDPEAVILFDDDATVEWVRDRCGIASRSRLDESPSAAGKWKAIEASYQLWLTDQRYAGSKR